MVTSPRAITLKKINLKNTSERRWLHAFIHKYHSTPKKILPTLAELSLPNHFFFRAFAIPERAHSTVIGITSYEIRTRFLAETQKTIVVPSFRGEGWGRAISIAIEKEVKKAGFKKIRTTIYADNLKMISIKLSQAYQIEGYHPDHEAPGLHEYSLGKIL